MFFHITFPQEASTFWTSTFASDDHHKYFGWTLVGMTHWLMKSFCNFIKSIWTVLFSLLVLPIWRSNVIASETKDVIFRRKINWIHFWALALVVVFRDYCISDRHHCSIEWEWNVCRREFRFVNAALYSCAFRVVVSHMTKSSTHKCTCSLQTRKTLLWIELISIEAPQTRCGVSTERNIFNLGVEM